MVLLCSMLFPSFRAKFLWRNDCISGLCFLFLIKCPNHYDDYNTVKWAKIVPQFPHWYNAGYYNTHLRIVRIKSVQFSSVQLLSRVRLFVTPWIAARQASLSITNSWSSLRFMSIESVMPSNQLILCHPLLLLPPIPPSIRVFSSESTLRMRWPKCWSFSFSISPSSEYSGLFSFRVGWLDLLAVQGTLKSLLQHHSSKRQFFGAQIL